MEAEPGAGGVATSQHSTAADTPNGTARALDTEPSVPQDADMIRRLLRSMGVEEFEPRVVNMLMDFMYRYTTEVLQDAEVFSSEHLSRPPGYVDMSGVMLAIQSRAAVNFAQPPPQDVVAEIAQKINAAAFEEVPMRPGLALPPDAKQLTAPNYQFEPNPRL